MRKNRPVKQKPKVTRNVFCRCCGSYKQLHETPLSELLTLLTGGLVELFDFREELPDDMFDILLQALDSGSIVICSMEVCSGILHGILRNVKNVKINGLHHHRRDGRTEMAWMAGYNRPR